MAAHIEYVKWIYNTILHVVTDKKSFYKNLYQHQKHSDLFLQGTSVQKVKSENKGT